MRSMRLSVLDALGFTALLQTRTSYRHGAMRPTHGHCVIRVRSVIGHHGTPGHHGAAVVRRPGRPAIKRHKLDMTRFLSKLITSHSLQEMNRLATGY